MNARRLLMPLGMMFLAACGGYGSDGGSGAAGAAPPPTIALDVQPAQVRLGEQAQLAWTASLGASCTATDGWSGAQAATGTRQVSPAAVGSVTFTLTCRVPAGGAYGTASTDTIKSVTLNVAPANVFTNTPLAADIASALVLDARLVNPWGIAMGATSTVWVANTRTDTATLYDGNGRAQPAASPRTVSLPMVVGGAKFEPTGIVANGSADFVVHNATASGPAKFILAGKRGSIAGWSPSVDANNALGVYDDPAAVYTGLAIAKEGTANFLYAADFHNGRIDVFDTAFVKQAASVTRFTFVDPDLPAGYAPFGIQALGTGPAGAVQLYVTYAKQVAPDNRDSQSGAGLGLVDVYDTNGQLLKQLIKADGVLNAPWGVALAPADFGAVSGRLLVSNFGDGRINSFGISTGQFGATLSDAHGNALSVPGVRGIVFGNDVNNQPHNTLFYAAGTNNEANGTFGRFDAGATPPLLDPPPVVATTLTQIQAQVFSLNCAGCHNGSNPPSGALPGAQNLNAGSAFANLVNVPSKEVPGLMRVKPGDPANSYLIQKLEGTAGIQGSRMPLGGPFLDQATIDQLKSWIVSGAPNN